MATMEQRKGHNDMDQHEKEMLKALIREQVIHTLGEPADLHNVQVRVLWGDRYRVNVLIGPDAASAKIANSYFLKTDSNGKIIESNPKLAKKY